MLPYVALLQLPDVPDGSAGPLEWLKWLAIVGPLLFAGYVLVRSRTASIWKEERDAALAKAARLEEENKALSEQKTKVDKELAECHAKTDLNAMMEQHRAFHIELLSSLTMVASANDGRYERAVSAVETVVRRVEDANVAIMSRLDSQTVTLNLINENLARMAKDG